MKSLCLEGFAAIEFGVFGIFVKGHAKLFHDAAGTFIADCKSSGYYMDFVFALGIFQDALYCFRCVAVVPVIVG